MDCVCSATFLNTCIHFADNADCYVAPNLFKYALFQS